MRFHHSLPGNGDTDGSRHHFDTWPGAVLPQVPPSRSMPWSEPSQSDPRHWSH